MAEGSASVRVIIHDQRHRNSYIKEVVFGSLFWFSVRTWRNDRGFY